MINENLNNENYYLPQPQNLNINSKNFIYNKETYNMLPK
jgi:hypothetical protein